MSEIVTKWLSMRLNEPFKWKPEDFGKAVRDGVIISRLLESYNVISAAQKDSIVSSDDIKSRKNNLLIVKEWLKDINIHLNVDDIDCLSGGRGSVALRIFYQMFLELDGKDRLYFIRKKMNRFSYNEEIDRSPHTVSPAEPKNPIKQMVTQANNLKNAKKKFNEQETINVISNERSISKQNVKKDVCESFNYTYSELRKLEEKAKNNLKSGMLIDKERVAKYANKIKGVEREDKPSTGFVVEMENLILEKMLYQCKAKEDAKKNVEMLLNLSKREKQMSEQLLKAKHEMTLVLKSRIIQQEEISRLREVEFSNALDDLKYEMKQKAKQLDFEKEILLSFSNKLHSKESASLFCETLKICKDTLSALLNYVYKFVAFRQMSLNSEIPTVYLNEWNTTFIYGDIENMSTNTEDIEVATEQERLILDEKEFLNYHRKIGIWASEVPDQEGDHCEYIESQGYKILECILNKILTTKYPVPKYQYPEPLPLKKTAAILLNAEDLSANSTFINLISEKNILIIHVQQAIAFCLEEYKKEMIELDEMTTDFETFETSLKKSVDGEDHHVNTISESEITIIENTKNANKHSQTPSKLPQVDQYSVPAQLGNLAYKCLNSGEYISDELLASIIVEYLRNNLSYDGWILVDYPRTLFQAQILEEKMSGKTVQLISNYDKVLEMTSTETYHNTLVKNSNINTNKYFQSKIISKSVDININTEHQTFFTAFLKLRQSLCIANEDFIWKLTEQNSTLIERFYADQGINYSIYYETFDEKTIKFIVEYVTGDIESYVTSSRNVSSPGISGTSVKNSKIRILKNERIKSTFTSSTSMNGNNSTGDKETDTLTTLSEISSDNIEEEEMIESKISKNSEMLSANCIDFTVPEKVLITLASLWEITESTYIDNLKELFYGKRIIYSELVPYVTHVRQHLKYPTRADPTVIDIIESLQNELNSIDDITRTSGVVKSEMYCKINEMQNELEKIIEIKKSEHKNKMNKLIQEDWVTKSLTKMTNIFVNMMQVELNRSQETLKIICDYYDSILGNDSAKEELKTISLLKLSFDSTTHIEFVDSENDKKQKDSNMFQSCVQKALMHFDNLTPEDNPFHKFIDATKATLETYLVDIHYFYKTLIDRGKTKDAKTKNDPKSKSKTVPKENLKSDTLEQANEINAADIEMEWESILNGEICRLKSRINIIHSNAIKQLDQCKHFTFEAFFDSENFMESKNKQETNMINSLFNLFNLAVEKECKIPSKLKIESENFEEQISKSWNLIIEKDALKFAVKCDFPVGQLAKLLSKLMIVSRNCSIPKKALIIMLQDFFILNVNNFYVKPNSVNNWNILEPDDFKIIVNYIYGDINHVDWRDFLILCLDIDFPDQLQLLELRKAFLEYDTDHNETIKRSDFYYVKFWFQPEEDCHDNHYVLRSCLVKEFLFLLFEVSSDVMNYSAFLLAFCKADNPESGLVKALSLALGKVICEEFDICESFAQNWIQEMHLKEVSHQNAILYAENLVTSVVDHTIRICSDVNISDIITPKTSLECFNKKFLGHNEEYKPTKKETLSNKTRSTMISESGRISSHSTASKKKRKSNGSVSVNVKPTEELPEEKCEVYFVSEDTIRRILLASLPWNCRMEFAEPYADIVIGLNQTFAELKFGANSDCVFIHRLLQHQFIKTLLHTIHKFKLTKPCHIVTEIILDRENTF